MNLLCFDTSSRDASIAVLSDEEIVLEYNFSSSGNLSAMLAPSLEFVLGALGMKAAEFDLFGVAVGPGLFTGIRVGLATLKGLDFAAGKPVVGVNTLEALASKFADASQTVVPMIDARRGEVYIGGFGFEAGEMREKFAPRLLRVEDSVPLLAPFRDLVFIGSGAENHADLVRRLFPGGRLLYRSNFLASEIGRIALRRFRAGRFLTELQQLLPVYIRRPDAEVKRACPDRDGE
jgi:tRNA threonylcarbamoyladenosine biosynthesis protein TsaB